MMADAACRAETNATRVLYVNNETGSDFFDGLSPEPNKEVPGKGPFASLQKAFSSVVTSDQISVANTGKPYPGGNSLSQAGGTAERPMVIDGHGAVISGLDIIPAKSWKKLQNNICETDFWPKSNYLRGYSGINHWIGSPQIWWLDGQPAFNCKSEEELKENPGGFFWNKKIKKLWIHLPVGKTIDKVEVKIPVHGTAININCNFVVVMNFRSIFSWNDGFDAHGSGKNIVFKNCIATDNCGQGFSCHDWSSVLYEDCLAERCASSGSCDVNQCAAIYRRCVLVNNTFEAGVYATEQTSHIYESCLIVGNQPFEQIWALHQAKMNFFNCVIIGNRDGKPGLMRLQNGTVYFEQCTMADAPFFCRIQDASFGLLSVRNCVLTRFSEPFVTLSEKARGRMQFENNVYFDTPGIQVGETVYGERQGNESGPDLDFDRESTWRDPQLAGRLKVEFSGDSFLHKAGKRYGQPSRVGAILPSSVWELYEKTRGEIVSPAGVKRAAP